MMKSVHYTDWQKEGLKRWGVLGNSNDDDSAIMEYTQHMQFADLKGEFKVEVIMA